MNGRARIAGGTAALFLVAAWGLAPVDERARAQGRIDALEELARAERAALVRERAECAATAVELPAAAGVCWRAYERIAAISARELAGYERDFARLRAALAPAQ